MTHQFKHLQNPAPLESHKLTADSPALQNAIDTVITHARAGLIPEPTLQTLLDQLPTETLRSVVERVAGTDESLLMTFTKQVRLVDAVLNNIVYPDGRPRESAAEYGIKLKDAIAMALRISQIMVRDLPKLHNMSRLQRMEQALGDIMESELSPAQRDKVLARIKELGE